MDCKIEEGVQTTAQRLGILSAICVHLEVFPVYYRTVSEMEMLRSRNNLAHLTMIHFVEVEPSIYSDRPSRGYIDIEWLYRLISWLRV